MCDTPFNAIILTQSSLVCCSVLVNNGWLISLFFTQLHALIWFLFELIKPCFNYINTGLMRLFFYDVSMPQPTRLSGTWLYYTCYIDWMSWYVYLLFNNWYYLNMLILAVQELMGQIFYQVFVAIFTNQSIKIGKWTKSVKIFGASPKNIA